MDYGIRQRAIADLAGVRQADVSLYMYGNYGRIGRAKFERIQEIIDLPKAQLVLRHLQKGWTLTPLQSLQLYGLHSLSQTITRLKGAGHDIRNLAEQPNQTYATYKYFPPTHRSEP